MWIQYAINVFDNTTDQLVKEIIVDNPDLPLLHKVFGAEEGDLYLYGGDFEITPDVVAAVPGLFTEVPDFEKYSYFFGAFAIG
jgi:hypothetical protein